MRERKIVAYIMIHPRSPHPNAPPPSRQEEERGGPSLVSPALPSAHLIHAKRRKERVIREAISECVIPRPGEERRGEEHVFVTHSSAVWYTCYRKKGNSIHGVCGEGCQTAMTWLLHPTHSLPNFVTVKSDVEPFCKNLNETMILRHTHNILRIICS